MVGQHKGTGPWLINYHVKKGNMMVVMMDLDQNLFPSTASFGVSSVTINHRVGRLSM